MDNLAFEDIMETQRIAARLLIPQQTQYSPRVVRPQKLNRVHAPAEASRSYGAPLGLIDTQDMSERAEDLRAPRDLMFVKAGIDSQVEHLLRHKLEGSQVEVFHSLRRDPGQPCIGSEYLLHAIPIRFIAFSKRNNSVHQLERVAQKFFFQMGPRC